MAHKYDKKTPREHVLIRPDTYIGSIKETKEDMWIFKDELIQKNNIKYVPGLYKIFDEILVNARDHTINDDSCKNIKITVDHNSFTVFNDGDNGIPVEKHPKFNTYVPSMIFGELLTSSNYDDTKQRTTGGRNGLGSKCIHINTDVLLFNGDIKKAKDIINGDILIGDDGTPRHVKNVSINKGKMYKVKQQFGNTYYINDNHTLTLMNDLGIVFDINIQDFINQELNNKYYGVFSQPVQWDEVIPDIEPYLLVLWLIKDIDHSQFIDSLKLYNLIDKHNNINKHIPKQFIINSLKYREKLLNAFIKTAATIKDDYIQFNIQNNQIKTDLLYLIRSMGYKCTDDLLLFTNTKNNGLVNIYDTIERDYVSITVDGNHRFIINDFTVTHNCANIFSTKFEVVVQDSKNKKHFHQIWEDNMSVVNPPTITKKSTKSFVQITCFPDFDKFGITSLKNHIPLFKKRVYDIACTTDSKIKVFFNDDKVEVNNLSKFIDFHFPNFDKIIDTSNDRFKVACIYFPDYGNEVISYVNGICTYNGGTHVEYITDMIIKTLINDYIKKKNKDVKVSNNLIKENLIFFIDSIIDNPSFSSQTKDTLKTPVKEFGCKYTVNDTFIKKLAKTGIVDKIINLAKFKENQNLKKTDGKKTNTIRGIPKLDDANKAGGAFSNKCTLILTEGDSAKTMVMAGLSVVGRDFYGVFPLKGKLLNVREATVKQLQNNEEIANIKKILGLRNDYDYTTDEQFNTLRYGKILLFTDQDEDGSHIKGLLINMFHYMWPHLLEKDGFLLSMRTPIVKIFKNKQIISFYTLTEYEEWKHNNNNGKGWTIKYYKGLGTSTRDEAKQYFKDIDKNLLQYKWLYDIADNMDSDSETKSKKKLLFIKDKINKTISDQAIELAFSKDCITSRKQWLMNYDRNDILDSKNNSITITDFIHKDLKHFSNSDNLRSIPSVIDGLKPSQRKILYYTLINNIIKDTKVAQLAGKVAGDMAYHHGENSLIGAIINMAQDYVGSNNINLLKPKGQFGSRLASGKDSASPRYIFTHLEKYTKLIFKKEDLPILNILDDDGQKIEPEFFLPIIPMILVNGSIGIGTGFSTNIPSFHPIQIIDNLIKLIDNNKFKKLKPWYKKFNGTISKIDSYSYLVTGNYNIDKSTLHITELPINKSTNDYKEFIEKLIEDDKNYISYQNNSSDETVDFKIKFKDIPKNIEDKFKLTTKINLTNLHAYTHKGNISKFDNILDIVKEFFHIREQGYIDRKNYMLKVYEYELSLISYKVKFIKEIIKETIVINNKTKKYIEDILTTKKYPKLGDDNNYDYLLKMNLYSLTKEKIIELEKELDNKQTLYDTLKNKHHLQIWKDELDELKIELLQDKYYN